MCCFASCCFVGYQINQHVLFKHRHVRSLFDALYQHLLHGCAGGIGHVHDASLAVTTFTCQVHMSIFLGELNTQRLQPCNAFRCMFNGEFCGFEVTQSRAGYQGILYMRLVRVTLTQHCSNATLRPCA